MSMLSFSRASFAVLFVAALWGGSAWNIFARFPEIMRGVSQVEAPQSVADVRQFSQRLQHVLDRNVSGRTEARNIYAWLQNAIGKSEMNNFSVIKAPNGRLHRGSLFPADLKQVQELGAAIADFAETAEAKGAKVLYLNTPSSAIKGAEGLPTGLPQGLPAGMPYRDFNLDSDVLLYTLRERGVPFIDARYELSARQFPTNAVTPRTAWLLTGEAAFETFRLLVEGLERRFGHPLDPDGFYSNIANYEEQVYPAFFMGKLGKETGPAFSGLDDFTSVTPGFTTQYAFEAIDMFSDYLKKQGPAEETLLNPNALIYYKSVYDLYPQSYYTHTNTAWSKVTVPSNPTGPKLLFIHDYYTAQIISHLAPMFSETHTLAYHENFTLTAKKYLEDNDFDYVVIAFSPYQLTGANLEALIGVSPQ
ncbi:MAG: hypothetical protein DELT_02752 [Desulfovibrio sp.]